MPRSRRAAARSGGPASLLPPQRVERAPGEQRQEREGDAGDRGAFSEGSAGDGALVGERDEEVGGVGRTTPGDGPDQLEVGEGEDRGEDREDGGERQEQDPGDAPEDLPVAGAVQGGGLVQLLR